MGLLNNNHDNGIFHYLITLTTESYLLLNMLQRLLNNHDNGIFLAL